MAEPEESAEAQAVRLAEQPLEESTRSKQKLEDRFVVANSKEFLKRAVLAMQNDLLPLADRLPKALEHIDALDEVLSGYFPHLKKYVSSDPYEEMRKCNDDLETSSNAEKGFIPKTIGGVMEQRGKCAVSAAQILNLRQAACRQIVQMNAQIIMNVTINESGDKETEPSIVEAEDYDVGKDFEDV